MTRLAAVREVEAGGERAFKHRAIRGHPDVSAVRLDEDFVFGHSHTSD
jgi:hypothetical protein